MPTRNLVLTDHLEAFVSDMVRSGRYQNASEVLRESLRLLERREQKESAKLALLRKKLDLAQEDVRKGRLVEYTPELLDELDREERETYLGSTKG
jgi:antitoxin ParD1/3/4